MSVPVAIQFTNGWTNTGVDTLYMYSRMSTIGYRVVKKTVSQFYFRDNFCKCAPILIIFSLLEQEIYNA